MSKSIDEKRIIKAQKFIIGAKEEFKKHIPKDTIDDIGITECKEKDGAFEITGSVSTTSPTKKLKTLAQPGASLYGIQFTNGNKIVVFGGGVPLEYNGKIIGGLGVSGGNEEQDTFLADFGGELFKEVCECMMK